jgi:hypothetical protein
VFDLVADHVTYLSRFCSVHSLRNMEGMEQIRRFFLNISQMAVV